VHGEASAVRGFAGRLREGCVEMPVMRQSFDL
jgi:hypothetical protein